MNGWKLGSNKNGNEKNFLEFRSNVWILKWSHQNYQQPIPSHFLPDNFTASWIGLWENNNGRRKCG
jgi:hypothetical protein